MRPGGFAVPFRPVGVDRRRGQSTGAPPNDLVRLCDCHAGLFHAWHPVDGSQSCLPGCEWDDESMSITHVTLFDGVRVPIAEYRPVWINNLADDVTLEGSAMNGVVQGSDAVRSIVTFIRTLYDSQEFKFAGPYGESGFLEDYTAHVRGQELGNVVLVTRNAAGQAQHIVANYRPRTTLLHLSRLIGEQLAGTPYGEHFATSAPE